MQRLSGLDAGFLLLETRGAHMHVASVAVFDQLGAPPLRAPQLRALVADRLHLLPPFRRRLVEVPFGLDRPVWIEDPDFDLDWHLRPATLPPPGGLDELRAFVAKVMGRPLDRDRPMWEMYVLDGLANGRVAVVTKTHHTAIDGASGAELTVNLLDLGPQVAALPTRDEPWRPESVPPDVELVAAALRSLAGQPLAGVRAARRVMETALALRIRNRSPEVEPPPGLFDAPRTFLNRPIGPDRNVAFAGVALDDIKRIKNDAGATVNDVVLAICSGGLRRWLGHRGERPSRSLVAMVPVNVRTDDQRGDMGNQVSGMLVSLESTVDEPLARLRAIAGAACRAKQQEWVVGAGLLMDLAESLPPALVGPAARLLSAGALPALQARLPPMFNVTISNVLGSAVPLYCGGAQMASIHPFGPITQGMALNITVMNYRDQVSFGLVGCPEVLPDLDLLPGWLEESAAELLEAVASRGGRALRQGAAALQTA